MNNSRTYGDFITGNSDLAEAIRKTEEAQDNAMTFLHSAYDAVVKIVRGITLIGAATGVGKTTCAVNILYSFIKDPRNDGRKACYVSSEENEDYTCARVACLSLGISFADYVGGYLRKNDPQKYITLLKEMLVISQRIDIVKQIVDTSDADTIVQILKESVKNPDVKIFIFDYLQAVDHSEKMPGNDNHSDILKIFGRTLKRVANAATVPVIIFAQLRDSNPKLKESFAARIAEDRAFARHCQLRLELTIQQKYTKFYIHNDRFMGNNGKHFFAMFDKGLLRPLTQSERDQKMATDTANLAAADTYVMGRDND